MQLFDITTKIYSSDSKTHKYWTFDVPDGLLELKIVCGYSPKYVEDEKCAMAAIRSTLVKEAPYIEPTEQNIRRYLPVSNLLSYSLDSPEGWIGTAHKHSPLQEHKISAFDSTYGFKNTPIIAGKWRFTVSVDGVVSDFITARFTVEGK